MIVNCEHVQLFQDVHALRTTTLLWKAMHSLLLHQTNLQRAAIDPDKSQSVPHDDNRDDDVVIMGMKLAQPWKITGVCIVAGRQK
eukprot:scaffold493996_cov16-Prasinocladus_malaysianus.AAC.1